MLEPIQSSSHSFFGFSRHVFSAAQQVKYFSPLEYPLSDTSISISIAKPLRSCLDFLQPCCWTISPLQTLSHRYFLARSMRHPPARRFRLYAPSQYRDNMDLDLEFCESTLGCKAWSHRFSAVLINIYRYYVLVAACVVGRKSKLLMNACLAAALLFPAVAAIHGIVLAALHVDGRYLDFPWMQQFVDLRRSIRPFFVISSYCKKKQEHFWVP